MREGKSAAKRKARQKTVKNFQSYLRGASSRPSPTGAKSSAPRQHSPRTARVKAKAKARGKGQLLSGLGDKCAHPTPGPHCGPAGTRQIQGDLTEPGPAAPAPAGPAARHAIMREAKSASHGKARAGCRPPASRRQDAGHRPGHPSP
jgi:hypothetical protein